MDTTSKQKKIGRNQKGFYQRGLHTEVLTTSFVYQGKYCIYGLASSEQPDVIQYIGYTSQKLNIRYNNHISERKKSNPKQKWINELLKQGHKLHMILLEESIPYLEQACEREEYYIATFRKQYPLKNVTKGGVGTKGMQHSKATKLLQSKALLNRTLTEEHKRKIGKANRKNHPISIAA